MGSSLRSSMNKLSTVEISPQFYIATEKTDLTRNIFGPVAQNLLNARVRVQGKEFFFAVSVDQRLQFSKKPSHTKDGDSPVVNALH